MRKNKNQTKINLFRFNLHISENGTINEFYDGISLKVPVSFDFRIFASTVNKPI